MATLSPVPIATMTKLAGRRIGPFDLLKVLGVGASGVVYLASDSILRRNVALKLIGRSDDDTDAAQQEVFLREARAAARLVHPNVVQIYQVGETEEFRYIAMEYVPGLNALKMAKKHGNRLPEAFCLKMMKEAAEGLRLAESLGICHRDIKPSNLLLTQDGSVKIADFGLASQISGRESIGGPNANQILGTPYYMSPEQWQGQNISPAVDIYSLGCSFYRLLIGTPPYGRTDFFECLRAHCNDPIPDPRVAMPSLDPVFSGLLQRCMAKQPNGRPKAVEIVHTITEILRQRAHNAPTSPGMPALGSRAAPADERGLGGNTLPRFGQPLPSNNGEEEISGDARTPDSSLTGYTATGSRNIGSVTYQSVYAMRGYPFSDIRQPSQFWNGGPYGWALRTLSMQLTGGAPLAMLQGPEGSGRTFLCDMLPHSSPDLLIFRVEPQLLFGERVLLSLCRQYGVDPNSRASLRFLSQVFVSHALPEDKPSSIAVIVIDTIDPNDLHVLEELEEIVNRGGNTRLAVLLVGGPDLWERLAAYGTAKGLYSGAPPISLRPMTAGEMVEYIDFRVRTIGGNPRALELDKATLQLLHARSGGSPKLVNVYCHNALTLAALRGEQKVSFESFRLGMKRKVYLSPELGRELLQG